MHDSTRPLSGRFLYAALLPALLGGAALNAQSSTPSADDDLAARVAALEARLDAQTVTTLGPKGLEVSTADARYSIRLRPRAQIDAHWFPDEEDGDDEVLLRRIRPVLEGEGPGFSWRLMPELANDVHLVDAWIDLQPWDAGLLRLGKFKGVLGLERRQGFTDTLFIERGLPSVLTPVRELGAAWQQSLLHGQVSYALGCYNGAMDDAESSGNLSNGDFDLGARVAWTPSESSPLHGLELGFAASWGAEDAAIDNGDSEQRIRYRTSGRNTFFSYRDGVALDGDRYRLNPQLAYYRGPLGLLAEYVRSSVELQDATHRDTVAADAWTLQAGWVLTGENASFRGVQPRHGLADGGWGALEVAVRYHALQVDDAAFVTASGSTFASASAVQEASSMGLGLNWYLSANLRCSLNYEVTDFSGLGAARATEQAVLSRLQLNF